MEKEFKLVTPGQHRGGRGRTAAAVAAGKSAPPKARMRKASIPQPVVQEERFAVWRCTGANVEARRDLPVEECRIPEDDDQQLLDILRRAGAMRYIGELQARKIGARALQSGKLSAEILYNTMGDYTAATDILCAAEDKAWVAPHTIPMPAPRCTGHALKRYPNRMHIVTFVSRKLLLGWPWQQAQVGQLGMLACTVGVKGGEHIEESCVAQCKNRLYHILCTR